MNMIGLWILGSILERGIGSGRFALIYFVSLLGGGFGALLISPLVPTVGASGAIFGLMGAAFMVLRRRGLQHHGERVGRLDRAKPGDHLRASRARSPWAGTSAG